MVLVHSNTSNNSIHKKNTMAMDTVPITIDTIEYDFEQFALQHGIPETVDPLPYRKTGSVFSDSHPDQQNNNDTSTTTTTGATAQQQHPSDTTTTTTPSTTLTSAKYDPRLRTVVCRHWLRDLCMKGTACEFLHQYDLAKMPLCRHGDRCKIKDCPFRHISDVDRLECAFYKSGFCIHGPFCRYKHVKRPREDIPIVADFALGLSQMQQAAAAAMTQSSTDNKDGSITTDYNNLLASIDKSSLLIQPRRPAPKPNEFYKISLCKHYMAGDCPFGDHCHFAHGEHELKTYPRKGQQNQASDTIDENNNNNTNTLSDHIFGDTQHHSATDYVGGDATGNTATTIPTTTTTTITSGRPCPIIDTNQASYFIMSASTQRDVAISTVQKEWYVQSTDATLLNTAYGSSLLVMNTNIESSSQEQVSPKIMIFFTVADSRHIQGVALMTGLCMYQAELDRPNHHDQEKTKKDDPFCYRLTLDWYRTTEFPLSVAVSLAPDLVNPYFLIEEQYKLYGSYSFCQPLPNYIGEKLMKAIWNAPIASLYESWSDEIPIVTPDNNGMELRAPINDSEIPWPIMPGPGYIFGCSSETMDECLGLGIFGLPAHMQASAFQIQPGTTIFLFNVTDRLLFGIFEALTPAIMNIVPTAFSKNPKAVTSPFPVQIRIRISLECPPLEDTDPVLNDILRARGRGRIGPLSFAQSEAIASLLANQCGALQYMIDYDNGIRNGANVRAPPIALPPKKLIRKDKDIAATSKE